MANFTNRFAFIGKLQIPKDKEKFYKEFPNSDGTWKSGRVNFLVKESETNGVFVELFGGYKVDGKGKIFSMDTENNKIEVPWADRNEQATLDMVANYKKIRINLGEQVEFISEYDAAKYLSENLPSVTGRVLVTGTIKKEKYKDKYNTHFQIQGVRLAKDDEVNKLTATFDVYYAKNSLDEGVFKEEKLLYLDGYLSQYINKDEGNKYISHQFVLNAKKVDFGNEKHKAKFEFIKKFLTVKGKNYVHIPWEVRVYRGAEEVEFDESMLTKTQKEMIAFQQATIDDFKPKNNILGSNVMEYRLVKPLVTGDFSDGYVDTELPVSEFEENIYNPAPKTEKFKEEKTEDKAPFEVEDKKTEDEDDLFA